MNWYNELCNNGIEEPSQLKQERPSWATHSFRRMGRTLYCVLYTKDWFWVNEEKSLYYTSDEIDSGSLVKL